MIGMLLAIVVGSLAPPDGSIALRTRDVLWTIGADGRNLGFVHRRTGRDLRDVASNSVAFFARIGKETKLAKSVTRQGNRLSVRFDDLALTQPLARAEITEGGTQTSAAEGTRGDDDEGIVAVFEIRENPSHIVMDVVSVTGTIDELTFGQVMLNKGDSPVEACALARNVTTNVPELPGASSILRAAAYRRFGFAGASAAFVTAPKGRLRDALKLAVLDAPDLPRSPIGGPWALESQHNRRSYLFNFGDLNVAASKPWIELAQALGAGQIDFHGGTSFRFGDFRPNPKTYPNGVADLKATVDALHAAGLQAGLHTYAFFIDKRSKYVSPVPDRRLAAARTFTLAESLDGASDTITVVEPTTGINATTGFFVTNSATLRIGDELITFREATQESPYRFLGCTRGALGTSSAPHAAGESAAHLKELFGLFAPDAETDLFLEIIENTARTYNECGFDMIYLDALDGSYIHDGSEWAWHYGARFVYELVRRLKKPAILEMSTFHHHLWCVRARMGAWDAARTGYKEFVDMHRVVNRDCERMYLPSHLGWWGVFPWNGIQPERTLPDDLEYLLCKALADDAGVSFVHGFSPDSFPKSPGAQRYAGLIRRYEDLRRAGMVPKGLRSRLAKPTDDFTLDDGPKGKRAFTPVRHVRHAVEGPDVAVMAANPYSAQPLRVRIEARLSLDSSGAQLPALLEPSRAASASTTRAADGVTLAVRLGGSATSGGPASPGGPPADCVVLTAKNGRKERRGSWAVVDHALPTPVDMTRKGLGVWIHGDGKGSVLNFQLRQPDHLGPGVAEHYVVVDFTGWRHCTFVEPESERLSRFSWPYAAHREDWERNPGLAFTSAYKTYHPWLNYAQVSALSVWMNEIPAGDTCEVRFGPITPIPLVSGKVTNPRVTVGGQTITFPVTLESGQYLEVEPDGQTRTYGAANEPLREIRPSGGLPTLANGSNEVRFQCERGEGPTPRTRLTLIVRDKPIRF